MPENCPHQALLDKPAVAPVRMLVWFFLGWCYLLARRTVPEVPPKRPLRCMECGGELHLVEITDHIGRVLYSHPLPYLDSG